jgi:hypothetical protein
MAKATKHQILKREQRIIELMSEGKDRNQIFDIISREDKVSPRTVETQYYRVVSSMEKLVDEDRAELRAKLMARQEAIFTKALTAGALKTALEATVAQAKLAGLNEKIEKTPERPKMITLKEQDFSGKLEAVPAPKVENE